MGFDLASLTNVVMFTFYATEYEVKKKKYSLVNKLHVKFGTTVKYRDVNHKASR